VLSLLEGSNPSPSATLVRRHIHHVTATITSSSVFVFLAIGGALFALALMLLLAWVLVRLLRERDARPARGFWWKLTLSSVGLFALGVVIFAGPWPDSWRESVDGEIAWWSGAFLFATAIVIIVSGLLSGVVEYASRRRLSH
jgi:TRAP-type C4-dicarboxylate transport system permease large subunit